jgi:hypothetical protein
MKGTIWNADDFDEPFAGTDPGRVARRASVNDLPDPMATIDASAGNRRLAARLHKG